MDERVPEYISETYQRRGISPLLYAIHADMTPEGDFCDAYVALDSEKLYILYGEERVVKTLGPRRIVNDYNETGFFEYLLKDLDLRAEKMLSTGRLIDGSGANERLIATFTLGFLSTFERLIKVIKNIKAGGDPFQDVAKVETQFCPICGTRYPEPERKICPKCMDKTRLTLRLLGFFKYYRFQVGAIILMMLFSITLMIFAPIIGTQMFLDDVLTEGGQYFGMVVIFVGILFGVRILRTAFDIFYSWTLAKIMPWLIYDLKVRIFQAMQKLSVGFYTSKRTGNLMNRVNRDANNIYWFFVDGMPFLIVNALLFIGVVALMFFLNWRLAIITVIVIPLCMLMFRLLFNAFRQYHHKDWVYSSQMNSMVSDSVNGQRVIKAFARENQEVERFSGASVKQMNVETRLWNLGFTAFPLIYLLMFLGQITVTAIGGIMVLHGEMSIGVLMTFIAYLSMLYGPLEFLSWVSNWWARCLDSAQRVFEIIDTKPEIEEPENAVVLDEMKGEIEIKEVWFEYDPATPVLKGLNLNVKAGTCLGIVGKTGAGKSTLANLIARLYDPLEGNIKVDGVNVKELSLAQLRSNIGIVSQEIYLFIGSIADNIRYAKPTASIEEVIWAAKMASAHEFIMNLTDGYETRVGAGGQDLSGGERQRISIARAIIQNPRILILDEATAAMDTETESKIQDALNRLQSGRTTIAIAHRLSTLKDADMLAVIDNGKVVETGTHEELMIKKGEYHKLFMIQMEGLKVISME